ncbi:prenyltransferase/squalene oxidase repeat-containing protein [Aureliella helgolandensis]|uniref:Prenyltransferase and squalene oxidase repeat protein n=1 Tax=Aureliella helgolandensis TaxID=2527968 RepID=A0A518G298_9BACT|nr:prenyltransferase/squalene oxidase repeat-containing protein [Aureliella helgolandensis]QDV22690.1 Prenyltransferase and squalene oxidase repeat protein [Aureliella helgolandensis]
MNRLRGNASLSPSLSRRQLLQTTLAASSYLSIGCWSRRPCLAENFAARSDTDSLYDASVDKAIRRGLEVLVQRQNPDGTFLSSEQGEWVGVCSLVGLAWLSRGVRPGIGEAGQALRRTGDYVLSKVQASGFLSAKSTSHGPMYDHGFGTLFLAELYGTSSDLEMRRKLSSAVQLIVNTQNDLGGWRYNPKPEEADLSVTVCQMMALRAARNSGFGVPKEVIDRAVDYVRRSQNPDGGFMYQTRGGGSRFPLTAAAIVALYSAGIYTGHELDIAFEYMESQAETNRSRDRNNFFYYSHYYSAQAFWHIGGEPWRDWYAQLKKSLLSMQNPDGGWFDFNSLEYGTAMACLILNMPRSVLPIFQR